MSAAFGGKGISLRYLRGGGQSVTQARNIGIKASSGKIHFSIDDDVVLYNDYAENVLKVYEAYPNASGVAGHMEELFLSGTSNGINKAFMFFSTERDRCRILPTGTSYPVPLTRVISCEWLSGTNCSYKREILQKFSWDERLRKYALCDDMDFSYRVHKYKPESLYMTPEARVIHRHSELARIASEQRIDMEISYHAYFYFKNLKQTYVNAIGFIYGIFLGRLVISLLTRNPKSVLYTLKAQLRLIRNVGKVKQGIFN